MLTHGTHYVNACWTTNLNKHFPKKGIHRIAKIAREFNAIYFYKRSQQVFLSFKLPQSLVYIAVLIKQGKKQPVVITMPAKYFSLYFSS